MTETTVDVLLFRLGPHRMAVELHRVSSVLAPDDARGMEQIDLRPYLLPPDRRSISLAPPSSDALVGLVHTAGPPVVVLLGEVLGAHALTAAELLSIPSWLTALLPDVLEPGCAYIDDNVVWLVDLDTLTQTALA